MDLHFYQILLSISMFGDVVVQKRSTGIWISTKMAILRTKKELPVLEYIDRGYMVIFYRLNNCAVTPAIHLTLAPYCHILLTN